MRRLLARQGDSLDAIAWRHYGQRHGALECLLLANPGLAGHGPLLALGTPVTLPDLPLAQPAVTQPLINLWE